MIKITPVHHQAHYRRRIRALSFARGSSLIPVLIIMVIISLIGVTAASISMLSSQATRYQRDYLVAYESAQAAIYDAIIEIERGSRKGVFTIEGAKLYFNNGCGNNGQQVDGFLVQGLCEYDVNLSAPFAIDMTSSNKTVPFGLFTGRAFQTGSTGLQSNNKPIYIIESLPDVRPQNQVVEVILDDDVEQVPSSGSIIYRITAMGFGVNERVNVVLQAEYRKQNLK